MTDIYIDDMFVYFKKDMHGENNDALLPTSEADQESRNVS